jgi:GR25 family glycosyltransferase involved in LPS biosynthesis
MVSFYDIPIIYINLEKRTDRHALFLLEMNKLNIAPNHPNLTRFNAIYNTRGEVGCTLSHIKCLENALKCNYEYVCIMEDDIEFVNPNLFLSNLNKFFTNETVDWDMLLLAGNNMLPYHIENDYSIRVFNCLTTTGYIVKKNYIQTLIDNFKSGVVKLMREPDNRDYRIDKHWLNLQRRDRWFLLIPPTAIQREGHSDIEGRHTNFRNYMLNYNKVVAKQSI